jgi:hypothetical protein
VRLSPEIQLHSREADTVPQGGRRKRTRNEPSAWEDKGGIEEQGMLALGPSEELERSVVSVQA